MTSTFSRHRMPKDIRFPKVEQQLCLAAMHFLKAKERILGLKNYLVACWVAKRYNNPGWLRRKLEIPEMILAMIILLAFGLLAHFYFVK